MALTEIHLTALLFQVLVQAPSQTDPKNKNNKTKNRKITTSRLKRAGVR